MRESLKQLAQSYEITSIYQLLADIITPVNEEDDEPIAVPVALLQENPMRTGPHRLDTFTATKPTSR